MTTILFKNMSQHKEKSVYFTKKIDEVRAMNKIEVNLPQYKTDFINDPYQKELQHWKKGRFRECFNRKMKQKN